MKNYNTQQRQLLLNILKKHVDESISTSFIISELSEFDISESAVYRNLLLLEEEGRLRRTSKPGDRKTYYQYIDEDECRNHIHISCVKCGKTSHVSHILSENLAKSLVDEDDFELDNNETVIYGICKDCKGKLS
ncbi:transcriptional repressor [bacterium]|nr:transcriptional repressor [bacterium]